MKQPGGILKNRKSLEKLPLTPPDIIGVNFTKSEITQYPELSMLKHISGEKQALTIAVDWFEIFLEFDPIKLAEIPATLPEGEEFFQWSDNVTLALSPLGSKIMSRTWDVVLMQNNEQIKIGWLTTHPRKPMGPVKENTGWFKMSNELLYQSGWLEMVGNFLSDTQTTLSNITRLDIAVDGVNDLCTWLNFYTKQLGEGKVFGLMGKAQFHCGAQDHKTMLYGSFRVGTSKSDKVIVVYNKSAEIEQSSGKVYIKNFWEKNGLIAVDPEKITSERFKNFNPDFAGKIPVVYRCELRLTSKAVETITDFDITRLEEPEYLASVFLTSASSAMRFAVLTDPHNISRCKQFFPIDFGFLNAELLDKSKKCTKDHRHKAKMGIHNNCIDILTGKATGADGEALLDGIDFNLGEKDLSDWFAGRIEKYVQKYYPLFPSGKDRTAVDHLLDIQAQFTEQGPIHREKKPVPAESEDEALERVLDEAIAIIEARKLADNSLLIPDDDEPPF